MIHQLFALKSSTTGPKTVEWSQKWFVEFNIKKCLVMHFGSNNQCFKYKMGSTDLDSTKNEKDLGIVFAPDLKWRQQVIACAAKANSMLGSIKTRSLILTSD